MTTLNLNETSLLAVSGESDAAARQRLMDHFAKHPGARAQYDRLKAEMELLRSLPLPVLSEDEKRLYAGNIKQGIQNKLQQARREESAARRRKLIYAALAGVTGIAATIVIVASVLTMQESANRRQQEARAENIRDTVAHLAMFQQEPNQYDAAISGVADSIQQMQNESPTLAGMQDSAMSNLLDALATEPVNSGTDNAPPDPGM